MKKFSPHVQLRYKILNKIFKSYVMLLNYFEELHQILKIPPNLCNFMSSIKFKVDLKVHVDFEHVI